MLTDASRVTGARWGKAAHYPLVSKAPKPVDQSAKIVPASAVSELPVQKKEGENRARPSAASELPVEKGYV